MCVDVWGWVGVGGCVCVVCVWGVYVCLNLNKSKLNFSADFANVFSFHEVFCEQHHPQSAS